MDLMTLLQLLVSSTLMYSAPLIFTAIAGTFSERGGIVNIGLEGIMVMGAFMGAIANLALGDTFGSATPWVGLLAGGLCGLLYSAIHAVATVHLRADHTISGTVLNIAAPALGVFLVRAMYGKAQTGPLAHPFIATTIPVLNKIPIIGPIFFTNTSIPAYLGVVVGIVSAIVLYRTTFGLRLRSVGEHPAAAETLGINVYAMRYAGVLLSGFLGGIGGAIQSQAIANEFSLLTISGQGFIAMAAMIIGQWHPLGAMAASLLFGLAQSLGRVGNYIPVISSLPSVFLQILPYVLTIVVLLGFMGQSRAPKADGVTYVRNR
ncbi:MAG: ABC transporter permease [Aerococcus sp.]|nr:ABC transporter permease [Aerococcus sp.]